MFLYIYYLNGMTTCSLPTVGRITAVVCAVVSTVVHLVLQYISIMVQCSPGLLQPVACRSTGPRYGIRNTAGRACILCILVLDSRL